MIENLKFHHIGIACNDLEKELQNFSFLGYKKEGSFFIDRNQGIKGIFIAANDQPRMELLINFGEKGTLNSLLQKGIKMYHICYETDDIFKSIKALESIGAKLIISPLEAVAFNNKMITFLMLPNMLLIELAEKQ